MSAPGVSVIMPCFNMAGFLPQAVASVMRQTQPVLEIVLVDAGSTDASRDAAAALAGEGAPIRLVEAGRLPPGPARNLGLEQVRGELIAFLDADDLWPADKTELQSARLAADPGLAMVSGLVTYFDELDPDTLAPREGSRTETIYYVHLGASLYRRPVLDRLGRFDPDFHYGEDVDLVLRVRDAGERFVILRRTTLYYRLHPDSMMRIADPRKAQHFNLALVKSVRRRRAAKLPPAGELSLRDFLEPVEGAG